MAAKTRIKLPDSVKPGEIIEVKTLITHVMETGNRKDKNGNAISRDIITTFMAKYGETIVFQAEFGPGISANPYLSFHMRVPGPGTFEFTWIDGHGVRTVETTPLNVV